MTLFRDVIQPLLSGLDDLNTKTKAAVDQYNNDTTTFQNYVSSSINGVTGTVSFLGQGADACVAAVNRNTSRAEHGTTKLGDFQLACDQTKKSLEDMTTPFDQQSNYYLKTSDLEGDISFVNGDRNETFVVDYFFVAQGYTLYDAMGVDASTPIVNRIREDTLPGLCWQLDTLLTPGKGQGLLEDNITFAASCIQGDFQLYQSQRHSDLDAQLHQGSMAKDAHDYY
ncbi:MAG: hypothetical protein ACRDHZ_22560, partial [Ktedonobacteraceae bacterium]